MKNYCCKPYIHPFIICDPCHFILGDFWFLFFLERIFISLHPNKFCLIWFHFSDGSNSKSGSTSIEKIPEKETIQINGTKNTVGADQSPAKKKSSIESLHLIESSSKQVSCNQMFTKCNLTIIVKLGSRSKVYLKSLIKDLDLELVATYNCMSPPPTQKTFLSRITLKSLHVWTD